MHIALKPHRTAHRARATKVKTQLETKDKPGKFCVGPRGLRECGFMAQLHVTRVRREFREVVNSEEVDRN